MVRSITFSLIFVAALIFFVRGSTRLIRALKIGRKDNRFDRIGSRLKNVLVIAFGQSKLLREPVAGLMHFFIFWGFVFLLTAVLEAVIEGLIPGFSLELIGPLSAPLAILQESVGILVLAAVIIGLARWYLYPPKRYFGPEISAHVRMDATLILCLIMLIMLSMFGANATRMICEGHLQDARYFSAAMSSLWSGAPSTAAAYFNIFWWMHILAILGFLNYLPYSKHLHVLTSIPNVYFSSLDPRGRLSNLNLEDENAEKFGVDDVRELTWKQLLDGMTCTDCGRCTAACPANLTGKSLSPRKIMMNIRQRTMELAPVVCSNTQEQNAAIVEHRLLDSLITDEELWACTTCGACMQECPVMIEHVPAIVDMRRYLVLTESRFPPELITTFRNLETNFGPWAFNRDSRMDWAAELSVPTMDAASSEAEILYWVGCAGAFDSRYQKVARSMVKLLHAAGVKFAVLGKEEKCTGDAARRSGNEYLAQMLMNENIETLNRYKVKTILTTCPHCFNTLKNEYPQLGGNFDVYHHTDYLQALIQQGRLKLTAHSEKKITFHDSCYLGRYGGVYESPRSLLKAAAAELREMPRSRDRGLCCGAGGARMFMEETQGKRINIERTEEALALNPQMIATACPFCMTMITDGVKAKNADEKVQVRDVAEVLEESVIY